MKIFTKEVKIALVAIVGIVVLFFGLNFLKGLNLFSSDDTYYMTFRNIGGLGSSTPIYADGYKVGIVKDIDYDYEHRGPIRLKVGIDKGMRIPQGSTAEIVKDLMGNIQVNLLLANNPRQRMEPGQTIPGDVNAGALGKVSGMVPSVEKMLPKLDSILTGLNAILADPAITQSLHNIRQTTANLTVSTRELNVLMGHLNHQVPGILRQTSGVLDQTQQFTGNLAALDVQGTLDKVDATLDQVHDLSTKLNDERGTLGLMVNNPDLYYHLDATVRSADSLLVNLKAHPKRYVHFSLFGRKDK